MATDIADLTSEHSVISEPVVQVNIQEAGYSDHKQAIQAISFEVQPGELVGLIGPNGAGKSTTIKGILGLLPHFQGSVHYSDPEARFAYIPEQPILYDELTLWEHLELAGCALELDTKIFEARGKALLERFRLWDVRHHMPTAFSKGMQQKMLLILGFLQRPAIYIVDEPFVGLDPRATKDFLDMLVDERKRGAGVLMSTHVLDTAERICDSFLLVADGKLAAKGKLRDIQEQCGQPGATLFECFLTLV